MKVGMLPACAALLSWGAAPASAMVLKVAGAGKGHNAHPVEGVIDLLKRLKEKVITEGQTEEITFAKFAKWCADSEKTLQKSVTSSKDSIDVLEDEIEAKTAEEKTLTEEIAELTEEIGKYTKAKSDADSKRTKENNLYATADKDFGDTIKAFADAITALNDARPGAAALVQEIANKLPALALGQVSERQQELLAAATDPDTEAKRPDLLAKGNYGKHTKKYSYKSNNVVELLKELKASFEDQRVETTKAETNAANAHELTTNARDDAILAANTAKTAKEGSLGDAQQALGKAKGDLTDAQGDLKADSETLGSAKKQCNMKNSEWEERSSIRSKEIQAIEAGVKILSKVTGVRTEKPTNPVPPSAPALFLQQTDPSTKAMNLLRTEAARLHSKSFARFAEELAARVGGPFDEVNNMIQKMIFRLMAEQKDEDDHKNWCDLELDKTEASRKDKEDKITELDLKMKEAKSSVVLLAQEIVDATEMVAKISGFMEEATEVRNTGKAENAVAITDAKEAQTAIARATAILEDFYKETGMVAKEAWEFMQKGSDPVKLPENPALWESPYTGVADPKNQPDGIINVLETIASDFSKMEAETKAQEATDEKNYQQEMKTQEIEKARRTKESEMKTQEKQRLSDKIISLERSTKHTKEEKAAMEQYLKDLKPACVEGDSTYKERKQARSDEIDALKEAQVILTDAFKQKTEEKPALFLQSHH